MKFILIPFLLIMAVYPLSYAKYNWKNKNRLGAVGMVLLVLASIVLPSILLFIR
jgi:hypothetical protein